MNIIRTTLLGAMLLGLSGLSLVTNAQGLSDVMLYSRMDPLGSARSMGMGGAMTSLGADLGGIFANPAGLALYRSSDVGISLGVGAGGGRTTFADNREVAAAPHILVGQVGAAFTMPINHPQFRRGTFYIGYAPLKDLHQRLEWSGEQEGESLTNQLALQAQGTPFDSLWYQNPFDADLAWYTYLIDTVGGSSDQYVGAFNGDRVRQSLRRDRSGRMGETALGFGTTYNQLLHIGLVVGLSSIQMDRVDVYSEQKVSGPSPLNRFTFNDRLEVTGSGAFWSFGLILQPENSPVRLGWSYRSGTVYSVDDFYNVDVTSNFSDGLGFEWNSPDSYVQYRIRTPRRHRLGASWTMGKAALLSLDYGLTDFRKARFTSNDLFDDDVSLIQSEIDSTLLLAHSVSGGLEFRLEDVWRFRCGGGWQSASSQPLRDRDGHPDGTVLGDGAERIHWALGGEYRTSTWYAGATYRHTSIEESRRLYGLSPEVAKGRAGLGMLMLSIGARY